MIDKQELKVLIACEQSGNVRIAFESLGVHAISCDTLPTARPGNHYQGDVRDLLTVNWDFLIGFPPCRFLTYARPNKGYTDGIARQQAINFFMLLMNAPAKHIAIENPVGIITTIWRKPDQIIYPWQFGHPETKRTCLWLKNLPRLEPTWIRSVRTPRLSKLGSCPGQSRIRSTTFPGIAKAMATQWLHALQFEGTVRPDL